MGPRSTVLFFLTSRKNAAGPKGQAFEAHEAASHEAAQVSTCFKFQDAALLSSSSSVPSHRTFSAHCFRATWRPVSSRVSALVQKNIYTYMNIYTQIHKYIYVYTYIYVDQYIYIFSYTHVFALLHMYTHIHTHVTHDHSPGGGGKESGIH